mmetsp:Transcript_49102/g.97562  ORF Transcript_49102/g.97562 Transcript_49102/m.97562 type:complete len:147 (-) Transcript_49102:1285-1725(-)
MMCPTRVAAVGIVREDETPAIAVDDEVVYYSTGNSRAIAARHAKSGMLRWNVMLLAREEPPTGSTVDSIKVRGIYLFARLSNMYADVCDVIQVHVATGLRLMRMSSLTQAAWDVHTDIFVSALPDCHFSDGWNLVQACQYWLTSVA